MQPKSANPGKLSGWATCTIWPTLAILALAGCGGADAPVVPPKPRLPFSSQTISLGSDDPAIAELFHRRSGVWASRTGAVVERKPSASADIVIVRPGDLGRWVAARGTTPVPDDLRNSAHALQWSRCLPVWSERLANWGGSIHALPLAGESYVLTYRTDRFAEASQRWKRPVAPPASWEDFAELAIRFAQDGVPCLPAVSADAERTLREFHLIAACYDRPAMTATDFATRQQAGDKGLARTESLLGFHHDPATGEPRLTSPAFQAAARWLRRTAVARPKSPHADDANPAAALAAGRSAMAILSLAELGRLPKTDGALPREIDLAPVPGTKVWFDAAGAEQPPADKVAGINYVPYVGAAGWLAIVRPAAAHPDTCFELIAELSGLERSTELLSDPALGFGPFRIEHLDPSRDAIWQRYGFDAERSRKLALAVRHQIGSGLAFPAVALRVPEREALLGILAQQLAGTIAGPTDPIAALKAADAAWRADDAKRPKDALQTERRHAAGLR